MNFDSKFYERGQILLDQNRYKEAAHEFGQILKTNPNDDLALNYLAQCQLNIPQKEKQALETISQAIGINAENSYHYVIQSQCLSELGKYKKAVTAADIAIANDPDDYFAYATRAAAYSGQMKWAKAEEDCRQSLLLYPDYDFAANLLAHVLRCQNKLVENESQVSTLLANNPENSFTHANAGWTALQKGDLQKSQEHFMESLRLTPTSEYARRGLLDTFKAKSSLYRLYLKYGNFMKQFTATHQVILIIGFLALYQISMKLFSGSFALLLTVSYLLFVLWSWVANGVGNLLLLSDRFARHVLKKGEALEGAFVGGSVIVGLVFMFVGFLLPANAFLYPGVIFLGAACPFSSTFTNLHKIGRIFYGMLGVSMLTGGIIFLLYCVTPFRNVINPDLIKSMLSYLYYAFIASMWLAIFGILKK